MRKPGIWGLGFRRQGIIRVADVIDDAGTTAGIVVHVAGNNTLFNQIVHIAPHGDNGQPTWLAMSSQVCPFWAVSRR